MRLGLLGITLLNPGTPVRSADVGLPGLIIEIAVDSLEDVATAHYAPARGIIYYSPARYRELGPELSAFFRAHEFGHLYYHHTRAGQDAKALRQLELAADCYAARMLAPTRPVAIASAITYFTRQGATALDAGHPAGIRRAARVRECAT